MTRAKRYPARMDLIRQLDGWISILRHSSGRVESLEKVIDALKESIDSLESLLDQKVTRGRSKEIVPVCVEDFTSKSAVGDSKVNPQFVLRTELSEQQRDGLRKAFGKTDIWSSIQVVCIFLTECLCISNSAHPSEFENDDNFADIVSTIQKHEEDLLEIEDFVNCSILSLWKKL